ncbi:MAG: YceI family protein [Bacteroidota bacterium]
MEKHQFFKQMTLWVALLCLPLIVTGQNIKGNNNSGTIEVSGTSSLHDWEMKLSKFEVSANLEQDDNGNYTLSDVSFLTQAGQLTSDKSKMESKAHEALKSDTRPEISFNQTNTNVSLNPEDDSFQIRGDLRIAGKTKPVKVTLNGRINGENQVQVTGNTSLKMTDFDIKPPTVMLGTIKTKDEVSIALDLTLRSN